MTSTDVSPAAVAAMISYLRGACVVMGEEADFIQALAEKLAEAEACAAHAQAEIAETQKLYREVSYGLDMTNARVIAANAEIARLRQQIAWFQAEAAKPPFRVEADFSPPLQEPAHD
jgi:peptidoglycan hydrolase CwlO-like protein